MEMIEVHPNTRYYTHKDLRAEAKKRGVKLGSNVSREYMCKKLDLPLGDRGGRCYRGAQECVQVALDRVCSKEYLILPSLTRAMTILGVSSIRVIKNRMETNKAFKIDKAIEYRSGDTVIRIPAGSYRMWTEP